MKTSLTVSAAMPILGLALSCLSAAAAPAPAGEIPHSSSMEESLAMWRQLHYGMFIHFGMSTFTGHEIDNGDKPSTTYAPTDLDVDQWIRVAHEAGMKYAVLTSKHVAGHCLWDSKVQFRGKEFDYDVATSSNKTDVVAEFVKACKKHGIMPGLYWCLLDFHNNSIPHGAQWNHGNLPDDFFQLAQDQFTELIRNYPDIGYYWIDIPRAASAAQRQTLYDLIKRLRPGTIVLFNHGLAPPIGPLTIEKCQAAWPTDVLNTERNPCKPGQFSPDQRWKDKPYRLGYEHCDCLAKNWFWIAGDMPRPTRALYRFHHDVIAAGGNLLLDVAPDRSGRIPEQSIAALMALKKVIDDPSLMPVPLNLNAKTTASNVWHNDPAFAPAMAVDDRADTRWATDDGVTSAWLEVAMDKPATFRRVVIQQAFPELQRVRKFAIEYRDGDTWKSCYTGGILGADQQCTFEPVTAQRVRLNIIEATNGPTIAGFELFEKPR